MNKFEELSNEEICLLEDLKYKKITQDDYILKFPKIRDYNEIRFLLQNSLAIEMNEPNDLFESILWCLPKSVNVLEEERLYTEFIQKKGHNAHEEMIGSFQMDFNKNKNNIPVLLQLIINVPEYLKEFDPYPYIRKIIYAVGAQPEPYNIEALEQLAYETKDEEVKKMSLHQIEKRKQLGRWESAKHI